MVSQGLSPSGFRYMAEHRLDWQLQFVRILEAVCRRLVATNDTLANIAASCGFRKLDRLNAAFKSRYGVSMRDYRTQNCGS